MGAGGNSLVRGMRELSGMIKHPRAGWDIVTWVYAMIKTQTKDSYFILYVN